MRVRKEYESSFALDVLQGAVYTSDFATTAAELWRRRFQVRSGFASWRQLPKANVNNFYKLLLATMLGALIFAVWPTRTEAAVERFRVFVHPHLLTDVSPTQWNNRVNQILKVAQRILCEGCSRARLAARQPIPGCRIQLVMAGRVGPFAKPLHHEGHPIAFLDWAGISELLSWGGQVRERTVYLVRDLRLDDSLQSSHYNGVTRMRVSVIAVGGEPHAPDWVQWQGATWAHELGHGVFLADLYGDNEKNRLMYYTTLKNATSYRLTMEECRNFENAF